ncbi:tetratricopeptide repeat protein [Budvicia diplopodorum]|uniref:tetratricopeptide repeat protein n=1 Tax=Budvicia diplopodorum TaxID=1119056 RepID=UPI001358FE21|nr:hypothetical protein [Budvicia diplopodorum]
MDIWNWVNKLEDDLKAAGQGEAARIIDRFTDDVAELNIDKADALFPEVLALSRSLKNPWLEVFVRHWDLRNRVGSRLEGEAALAASVELFEFAHRPETMECPQSVCVTQDLAGCYANIDGPGWVNERIAVCEETLARIDTSWNCFHCLSCEYAEALLDDGHADDALTFLRQQEEKVTTTTSDDCLSIHNFQIKTLLNMARYSDAMELIEKTDEVAKSYPWQKNRQFRNLLKARCLAGLGRDDEALEAIPAWSALVPEFYMDWTDANKLLLKNSPDKNTWQLGGLIQKMLDHVSSVGAHRHTITLAVWHAQLALARGAVWTARRSLDIGYQHLPKLNKVRGADLLLDSLKLAIEQANDNTRLPVPADRLLSWLEQRTGEDESRNPEEEAEWLVQASLERPDDEDLIEMASSALVACGAMTQAKTLLWQYVSTHPSVESALAYRLLDILLDDKLDPQSQAEIVRLSDIYQPMLPAVALWCLIKQAQHRENWSEVERLCKQMIEAAPEYRGPRMLLAEASMNQKSFQQAIECYQQLAKQLDDPSNTLWDLMTAASAAERWDLVRETAERLDIKLAPGEGEINEDWGWVRLRIKDRDEEVEYYGQFIGPVTARVMQLAAPNGTQCFNDVVVIDAGMLENPPEDEEERKEYTAVYRVVHTLKRGNFGDSWFVDGVMPTEEQYQTFVDAIEQLGWQIRIRSSADYQVSDAQDPDGEPLDGIYFYLAAPENVTPAEINAKMWALTQNWQHDWCWLTLAEEADAADVERHRGVVDRYSL